MCEYVERNVWVWGVGVDFYFNSDFRAKQLAGPLLGSVYKGSELQINCIDRTPRFKTPLAEGK